MLLRGINVGGKNPVPMARLRGVLGELGLRGCRHVHRERQRDPQLRPQAGSDQAGIEAALPKAFKLHAELIAVLVLTAAQLRAVVADRPKGFGDQPGRYHSDAIFLMGIDATAAMEAFDPREGVDAVWPGKGVIYSQRLSAQRTKSRLNRVMASPHYKSMTIRNWATTTKLAELVDAPEVKG